MADLEKTVSILFKAVDNASTTIDTVGGSLSSFNDKIKDATAPFAALALGVEKLDAALAALALGGLTVATVTAGGFQNKTSEINTLIDVSSGQFATYKEAILDYSRNSVKSIDDINNSIYFAISAGVDWKNSIEFVSAAETLAVAGRADLSETTKVLIGTMNAYGESTDKASQYSDDFFTIVKLGQTTLPELNSSIAQVTAVAAPAGVSFKEIGAAMAALTVQGVPTAQAATFLKGAIMEMIKPSKQAADEAANLGLEFGATHLKTVGLAAALGECWKATDGNTEAMAKLFGNIRGLEGSLSLGADASGKFSAALQAMQNDQGAAAEAYAKMAGAFENVNQRLLNNLKATLIDAGTPLLKDWALIARGLQEVFVGLDFGIKEGAFNDIYAAIDEFSTKASAYLKGIGAALPEALKNVDFTAFLSELKGLGVDVAGLFTALFGDFDLTKPDELAKAIQKIVDAGTQLVRFSDGIATQLKPFATELGNWINKAIEASPEMTKLAGSAAGLGQAVNGMVTALGFVGPAISIFSGALILDGIATIGKLTGAFTAIGTAVSTPVVAALGLGTAAIGSMALAANQLGVELPTLSQLFGVDSVKYFAGELVSANIAATNLVNKGLNTLGTELPTVSQLFGVDSVAYFSKELYVASTAASDLVNKGLNELGTELPTLSQLFGVDAVSYFAKALYDVAKGAGSIEVPAGVASAALGAIMHEMNDIPDIKTFTINPETGAATEKINALQTSILSFPADFKVDVSVNSLEAQKNIGEVSRLMADYGAKTYTADFSIDDRSYQEAKSKISQIINPDGTTTWVNVGVNPDALSKTKSDLDEIPSEKILEIKAQGDVSEMLQRIKSDGDIVQKAMEWTAKVDIAQVEADAERVKSAFDDASSVIDSTSKEIVGLMSKDWGKMDMSQFMAARDTAAETLKIQKETSVANIKLLEEQARYQAAQTKRLENGHALITIDTTGVEPAIEAVMWQIINKCKLKANEQSAAFLLGI